ncbi:MAG: hypothetical protein UV37_C0013G0002 [Candidatus Collierbacteria bacterium GW2011_GWA1_42_60]|nr:MAG: hypothetical protein UV28_C0015G0009 [Candidatus Collierbacteria bacterium GW2011_GWE2_42_48]KKS66968.1 MAG: hypothetical protein UV37_C0013G0002 [Candidatus Collierbacteria bacterium GW2011_GWA1_42_60]
MAGLLKRLSGVGVFSDGDNKAGAVAAKWFTFRILDLGQVVEPAGFVKDCAVPFSRLLYINPDLFFLGRIDNFTIAIFFGAGVRFWTKVGVRKYILVRDDNSCGSVYKYFGSVKFIPHVESDIFQPTRFFQCVPPLRIMRVFYTKI